MDRVNHDPPMEGGSEGRPPPKKVTVEKIYQKKTQLEHILLRPDTYIGSVEPVTEDMWVFDEAAESMVLKKVTYVPGLYKIFDEILVNAADNKQRDEKMDCIKIDIDKENNIISIFNNGKGIPVVEHKEEKMPVPTMIFGHLLTSSNYDDAEEKVTGGRNGYGAKLCNIFSTRFTVETASKEYKRSFKQTWASNMTKASEPKIKDFMGEDYTKVTFSPDLTKFKMTELDADIVSLMKRRAYDIAASTRGVKVYLNGKRLPIKGFKDYVDLYVKNCTDETGNPLKVVYENVNPRWEVAVSVSEGFRQVSFVNSIATTKGGRHVEHVADLITKQLIDRLKKKNKTGFQVKPFQVKNHLWIFINCLIVNPTFDSQTKENMTLQAKKFGSKCILSEKFITSVTKCGIVESVLLWARTKAETQLQKTCSARRLNRLPFPVPKLEEAIDAGTNKSKDCTLILTEGDSAKSLAMAGLGVVGRAKYGVFPLRGKLLNVREASVKQVTENQEIKYIVSILGLQYKKKYETMSDIESLRYGKLMIMTDQDQDGSHIKGLLINFIHHNWPSLLKLPFLEEFITPIVKATKGNEELSFFSLPEYEEWKANTENWPKYKIKYYKGLGTSTSKEAKMYFSDMDRHRIQFKYSGPSDDYCINMAFSKKCPEQRKEWLTSWMEDTKRRHELGIADDYLYVKNTKYVTFTDFINKELVLFSNCDNERSIPSAVDGLKPGQRKVLYTCFKRNDKREVKVAQLAGSVAEHSAYHHGETSLMSTIVNLAQNYVGSNNINLLLPIGQFGTRLTGGKDAASARYIFTMLSPLTRIIFHPSDDPLLHFQNEDNQRIEPFWYIPIIPMLLVNGADGIGTGWMTKIPNYNPREIVHNLLRMLDDEEPKPMIPWYKNYKGVIEPAQNRFVFFGEISVLSNTSVEITELPIATWTQSYKESVLEPMLHGAEKTPAVITDYKEYSTDTTVRFVVSMSQEKLAKAEQEGLHKFFKLHSVVSTSSMCAFDENSCIRRYDDALQIMRNFYKVRIEFYGKRKDYLEGMLQAEALKLSNQARFIIEKCDGRLVVENKQKKVMIEELKKRGYNPDPVKAWKCQQNKEEVLQEQAEQDNDNEDESDATMTNQFDYLLGMTMWSLTKERKDELLRKRDEKQQEYETLKQKTPKDLWREDLAIFMKELDRVEKLEIEEAAVGEKLKPKAGKAGKGATSKSKKETLLKNEAAPSPNARRVVPKQDIEMIKKFERSDANKEGKGKRVKKVKDEEKDEFDLMVEDTKSLKERLGNSPEMIQKKFKAQRKEKLKQAKDGSPTKKKRGPKKKAFSDDSGSDLNISDTSDFDSPVVPSQPTRTVARRSAASKVKFTYSDSESDDSEPVLYDNSLEPADVGPGHDQALDDYDDDEINPGKRSINVTDSDSDFGESSRKKKETKKKVAAKGSDDLFDSLVGSSSVTTSVATSTTTTTVKEAEPKKRGGGKKPTAKKPSAPKPKKRQGKLNFPSDSEDDDDDDSFSKKAKRKKADDDDFEPDESIGDGESSSFSQPSRQGGRVKKQMKYYDDDSDEDDDMF